MKILYHHRIASKDGQYVHIEELTHALGALGHDIVLVGPPVGEGQGDKSERRSVALLKRYMPRAVYELIEFGYSLFAYRRLARAIRAERPGCIYERYNLFMPAGIWASRRFGLPLLLEVNAPLYEERGRYHGIALRGLARWSEDYAWRNADRVLVVSGVLAERVRARGVPPGAIVVIPNGIDLEKFDAVEDARAARARLGIGDRLVLGFVGYMREWHGLERVVDLLTEETDAHLLLVGDGPARASIERRAQVLGVSDRLTVTGIVGRDRIAGYLAAFDIALQPDVVDYASPLKLFEYMACARAIVAPDKPNVAEIVSHGESALLFDPADPNGLADAVRRLCRDAPLRARLSVAARQTILDKGYTWKHNAGRVVRLFEQLLSEKARRGETL